jgi:hypothetical protein
MGAPEAIAHLCQSGTARVRDSRKVPHPVRVGAAGLLCCRRGAPLDAPVLTGPYRAIHPEINASAALRDAPESDRYSLRQCPADARASASSARRRSFSRARPLHPSATDRTLCVTANRLGLPLPGACVAARCCAIVIVPFLLRGRPRPRLSIATKTGKGIVFVTSGSHMAGLFRVVGLSMVTASPDNSLDGPPNNATNAYRRRRSARQEIMT